MSFMLPQRQSGKLIPVTRAGVLMPTLIAAAGDRTARRFIEFFTANIRNKNTRAAYGRAVGNFLAWCEKRKRSFAAIDALTVQPDLSSALLSATLLATSALLLPLLAFAFLFVAIFLSFTALLFRSARFAWFVRIPLCFHGPFLMCINFRPVPSR